MAIVTGFCVVDACPAAAETDGPPGALLSGPRTADARIRGRLISDAYGMPLLEAGCDLWQLPRSMLREFPFEEGGPDSAARMSNAPEFNQRPTPGSKTFMPVILAGG